MTSSNTLVEYETNLGCIKTAYKIANTVNGTTYTINSDTGYTVTFPSNLFTGTSITDLTTSVKLLTIDWYISPILLCYNDTYTQISDTLTVTIIDNTQRKVDISSKSISLKLKMGNSALVSASNLGCQSWTVSTDTNSLIEET